MSKKKIYQKKQKKKKILNFLKDYAAVITIIMSILAVITNGILKYYKKASDTEFYFQYLTVKIDTENFVKEYQNKDYGGFYHEALKSPTVNNKSNKLLYKDSKKITGYYITYLIMEQRSSIEAQNLKINFKQYGQVHNLKNHEITDYIITKNKAHNTSIKINYPFPKGEKIKVPISICKNNDEYTLELSKCYFIKLEPTSIEYNNKYLGSKRKVPIRDYIEKNVIIDGQVTTGKGSA